LQSDSTVNTPKNDIADGSGTTVSVKEPDGLNGVSKTVNAVTDTDFEHNEKDC